MKVTLNSCPYCGAGVSEVNSETLVCLDCGKRLCADRVAKFTLASDSQQEGMMSLNALMQDGLFKEALKRVDQILENDKENYNLLFLKGIILSFQGEDGRAFTEWKNAIQLLGDNSDFDSYLCLICKTIANMIYQKESEFIEFDFIKYIDRVAQMFSEVCHKPLRAFTHYTVYINYTCISEEKAAEGKDLILYVLPKLFRNVVVYYTNYPHLREIVENYLEFIEYNPETYEEDGMEQCHLYDVVSQNIDRHCHCISPERIEAATKHWNDDNMSDINDAFTAMEKYIRGKKKGDVSLEGLVHSYTHLCLLLDECKD